MLEERPTAVFQGGAGEGKMRTSRLETLAHEHARLGVQIVGRELTESSEVGVAQPQL